MKERRYPLNIWLSGHQRRSGRFGEEKNLLPLPGFEPRTVQPVAIVEETKQNPENSREMYLTCPRTKLKQSVAYQTTLYSTNLSRTILSTFSCTGNFNHRNDLFIPGTSTKLVFKEYENQGLN